MSTFRYLLRDTFRLIFRHWGMSLLTLFSISAVFFLLGASSLLSLNTRHLLGNIEGQLTVQAYLKPGSDLEAAKKKVLTFGNIVQVVAITPDEALEHLKARLGNRAEVITLVGENPLPSALEIRVERAAHVSSLARRLVAMTEVEDVVYAGGLAEKLSRLSVFVGRLSVGILVIAVVAAVMVLFNTVRMAVYSRRDEIHVMLQVGATQTYVALPFVLQGMLLGMTGAAFAALTLLKGYSSAINVLAATMPFLLFLRDGVLLAKLGVVLVGAGICLGWIASWFAVVRYIRDAVKPL
ncbi:MAG: permease-like cell division protein FtsX [Synergistales bacterium]|nr:permease-like cell division protein FtsX [Synergistales bacterium]